jgi:hypothetical protein
MDLITKKIVFARNHVATQAAVNALPYCIDPATQLDVNGVNIHITKRRDNLRYKQEDCHYGVSPAQPGRLHGRRHDHEPWLD